ncbi:hypothetical protein FS935_16640 [Metabacillus litoralis]|uniref:HEAT repeat domain-containing protein n=1 Tax=Metabacillus litoralis TaxID=152268 RepID=A0A5C6W1E8_9BACI|nr:hypothetical protein [Metabacillus litoralis]TXC89508.1 hypothetical protein FS935_16640 [Metabacillus litoralis]
MNFKDRVEPILTTDDPFLQEFISYLLHDYPGIESSWLKKLLHKAKEKPESASTILLLLNVDSADEDVARMLAEGVINSDPSIAPLYLHLVNKLSPELVLTQKQLIESYISTEVWDFYELLKNGTEDVVWPVFFETLSKLESSHNEHEEFQKAKKIAYTLVQRNWITIDTVVRIFQENLEEDAFYYSGILAIYLMRLMKLEQYMGDLAKLLEREDEDLLLDEVCETLISFQSPAVIDAIKPYLSEQETNIYALSIAENIKIDESLDALRNAYYRVERDESKVMIIEALANQLHSAAEKEINDFVSRRENNFIVDLDLISYGYYKIVGIDHPLMSEWVETLHNRA